MKIEIKQKIAKSVKAKKAVILQEVIKDFTLVEVKFVPKKRG